MLIILLLFRMSDINTKSPASKLRGNETEKNRGQNRTTSDSGLQVDPVAYGSLHNSEVWIT